MNKNKQIQLQNLNPKDHLQEIKPVDKSNSINPNQEDEQDQKTSSNQIESSLPSKNNHDIQNHNNNIILSNKSPKKLFKNPQENSYSLQKKEYFKQPIFSLQKARPETPTYQGKDYGFSDKKIMIRQLGYSSSSSDIYYADNGGIRGRGQRYEGGQTLNLNKDQAKNWIVVYNLEQPKLIKNICQNFIDINNEFSDEQKDEMLNGWIGDFVETHSNATLNDIDQFQLYLVVKYISFQQVESFSYVTVKHFSFVVGQNYLLTFLEEGNEDIGGQQVNTTKQFTDYIEDLMSKIARKEPKYIKADVYYILFKLIDKIVEHYKNALKQFTEKVIDPLDTEVIDNPTIETLKKIHSAKNEMVEFKYAAKPLKDMIKRILKRKSFYNTYDKFDLLQQQLQNNDLNMSHDETQSPTLLKQQSSLVMLNNQLQHHQITRDHSHSKPGTLINPTIITTANNLNLNQQIQDKNLQNQHMEIKKYQGQFIKMIYDEIIEVNNDVHQFLEILQNQLNIYLSNASNNMADQSQKTNEVMKFLTLVTSVFIPLSFLTGLYGMNFENMPELKYENSYYILLGTMFIISVSMIVFFRKKQWWITEDI